MLRKKSVRVLIAIAALVVLLACGTGTVCAKRYDKATGDYYVSVQSDAESTDGKRPITETKVSKEVYDACIIGEQWPKCKEGAREPERERPRGGTQDKPDVVRVAVTATGSGWYVNLSCPDKEVSNLEVTTRSYYQRCLVSKGQRVTVVATGRGITYDCRLTIAQGATEVDSNTGANAVRCTWRKP